MNVLIHHHPDDVKNQAHSILKRKLLAKCGIKESCFRNAKAIVHLVMTDGINDVNWKFLLGPKDPLPVMVMIIKSKNTPVPIQPPPDLHHHPLLVCQFVYQLKILLFHPRYQTNMQSLAKVRAFIADLNKPAGTQV